VILHQSRLSAGAFAAGWVYAVAIQRQHRRRRNQHRAKGDLSIGKSYIVTPVYESHELSPLHARACAPRSDLPRKAGMPLFSELGCGGGRDAAGRSSFPLQDSLEQHCLLLYSCTAADRGHGHCAGRLHLHPVRAVHVQEAYHPGDIRRSLECALCAESITAAIVGESCCCRLCRPARSNCGVRAVHPAASHMQHTSCRTKPD